MSSTWYHLCIPLLFLFRSFTADSLFDSLGRFSREITFWRPVWSSVCGWRCCIWYVDVDAGKKCPNSELQFSSGHTANVLAQSNQLRRCVLWGYGCHKKPGHKKGVRIREEFFHWTRNLHLCRSQGISTLNQVGRTQDRNRARNWCHYCTFGIQVRMVLLGSTGWPKLPSSVNGQGKCGPNLYACVATALRLFNCQCHCQGPKQWKSKASKHTLNQTNETRDVPAGPGTIKKTSIVNKNKKVAFIPMIC